MENWDEDKLRKVVLSKHGNPRTTTDVRLILIPIVTHPSGNACRSYANTSSTLLKRRSAHIGCLRTTLHLRVHARFGWFWECPNGGEKCQYRHALPPGFVLKSQRKAIEEAEKANTISLEEFLEVEVPIESFPLHSIALNTKSAHWLFQRHKLGQNLTPVTPETFAKWKQTRMDKKQAEEDATKKAKETAHAAGKNTGMSGRDLVRVALSDLLAFHPIPIYLSITRA